MKPELEDILFSLEPMDIESAIYDSAHMVADHYMYYKLIDEYCFMHIKKKPKYIPTFLYNWMLKKVVILNRFKAPNKIK